MIKDKLYFTMPMQHESSALHSQRSVISVEDKSYISAKNTSHMVTQRKQSVSYFADTD
jgi:hypothetical protein